ncbi:MAG TPA: class I SAM-dependent methyltransferase [Roseomonas sp.]|nr:class I SAM-dependent methyltransferase [Roseomonas sp.]
MSEVTSPPRRRPNHSARRINALAHRLGARRYLEIGVNAGQTFRDVEIAERVGVDPDFRFDTAELADATTRLHAMESDTWFASVGGASPFDIAFIDGLHVFEQVVRDLTNTLARTGWRSAILIDDTVPVDVFSSLPSHRDAIRFRRQSGGANAQWHGDVFKIIFLIHDFFPFLDYRTIVGSGNPQTLVWRAAGLARRPVFNDVERISRLDWFALQAHPDVMQTAAEAEAIDLCVRAIEGQ